MSADRSAAQLTERERELAPDVKAYLMHFCASGVFTEPCCSYVAAACSKCGLPFFRYITLWLYCMDVPFYYAIPCVKCLAVTFSIFVTNLL